MNPDAVQATSLTALLVDDERRCRDTLSRLLAAHCPQVREIEQCGSVEAADMAIRTHRPDLVFLDIMLPDGTGFDLLRQLHPVGFKVIFTTAHEEHAIRAIRFSALDYLMKPVMSSELVSAVARACEAQSATIAQTSRIKLLHENLFAGDEHAKIALPTLDGFLFVELGDIVTCEARRDYTACATTNGETLLVCRTLKEFEELLSPHGFFRVHHSHIINLRHLRRYVRGKGGYVVMSNGREFEVSVRRKEEFIAHIGS
jgi:two-component system, LytTR family, response regulator